MFLPNENFNLYFPGAKRYVRKVISNTVQNVTVNCAVVGFTSLKKLFLAFHLMVVFENLMRWLRFGNLGHLWSLPTDILDCLEWDWRYLQDWWQDCDPEGSPGSFAWSLRFTCPVESGSSLNIFSGLRKMFILYSFWSSPWWVWQFFFVIFAVNCVPQV